MKKIVFAISVLTAVVAFGGTASAQADACSTNGGYPPGSPNAVMARMRDIASGAYAACVEAQRARTPPVNWTPTRIRAAARQAVTDKLRDPSSAQFRNVRRIEHSNGSTMFCGEVNGRNAYGGMSGFQRFEAGVDRTGDASALIDGSEELNATYFEGAWNQFCGRIAGTPVQF
ncbi:Uncharacterised protein [Brevundimonas diminuta]|jgi:hypothetical protein|uniref:hypothetical protein n=1 Tax=Brevundimonas TaxID=41275 RepID=UPI000D840453|nr:hypothetical protein [Brevundimonas diminuta]MBI2248662.1 hypothetical protein [Brevundimonas diminuta]MBN9480347.1 hypothetical protein [Bordetella sp.]SPU45221.1 Uncharacterised protein [Brevundimonas diminuta]